MQRTLLVLVFLGLLPACGDVGAQTVAFGDSVTYGYGGQRGGWVSHLERATGDPIANYGWPGERAADARLRLLGPTGPLALQPWADRALLTHGGNDLIGVFAESPCSKKCEPEDLAGDIDRVVGYLGFMVDQFHYAGMEVVLGTYWHLNADMCNTGFLTLSALEASRGNAVVDAYNDRIVELAARKGASVVRMDDLDLEYDLFNYYDCIHPSDEGYRLIAARWAESL